MSKRLRCENPRLETKVLEAWVGLYGHEPQDAVFEHGQWWILAAGKTFSVCDASGPPSVVCDGFCFEEC